MVPGAGQHEAGGDGGAAALGGGGGGGGMWVLVRGVLPGVRAMKFPAMLLLRFQEGSQRKLGKRGKLGEMGEDGGKWGGVRACLCLCLRLAIFGRQ